MITLALLDILAILGLLVDVDEVLFLFGLISKDLGIKHFKATSSYLVFHFANNKGKGFVEKVKHNAFLLC